MNAVVDTVLPPRCPACRVIVETAGSFCGDCWRNLSFITRPMCARCGDPFEVDPGPDALCGACLAKPPRFTAARAALAYGGPAVDVLMALKHSDRHHLAAIMAGQLLRAGADWFDGQAAARSILVPVPLHRWRLWRRGYNQAALLAQAVSRLSGVPLVVDALERHRPTRSSAGLGRAERAANVRGALRLHPRRRAAIAGRRVILVDDVLTTGATAEACARTLLAGGADAVNLLTWARVVRDAKASHI